MIFIRFLHAWTKYRNICWDVCMKLFLWFFSVFSSHRYSVIWPGMFRHCTWRHRKAKDKPRSVCFNCSNRIVQKLLDRVTGCLPHQSMKEGFHWRIPRYLGIGYFYLSSSAHVWNDNSASSNEDVVIHKQTDRLWEVIWYNTDLILFKQQIALQILFLWWDLMTQ